LSVVPIPSSLVEEGEFVEVVQMVNQIALGYMRKNYADTDRHFSDDPTAPNHDVYRWSDYQRLKTVGFSYHGLYFNITDNPEGDWFQRRIVLVPIAYYVNISLIRAKTVVPEGEAYEDGYDDFFEPRARGHRPFSYFEPSVARGVRPQTWIVGQGPGRNWAKARVPQYLSGGRTSGYSEI
jgi:hypothetical protein